MDGHISVANSAALKFAGITRASADPAGGKIDRDAAGEPTGILRETAKDEVLDKLPKPTPAQRRHALELALADAAQSGVTSVQDYSDWEDFLTFEELEREGKLRPFGQVDGEKLGIAILDHPANPKHPTFWHARDYGLFAANIFGEHDFFDDKSRNGSVTIEPGKDLRFRYRVIIHSAGTDLAKAYAAYGN